MFGKSASFDIQELCEVYTFLTAAGPALVGIVEDGGSRMVAAFVCNVSSNLGDRFY